MKLRCLKAEHGDAFIIEIGEAPEKHYIVVDGGPSSKYCIDDIVEELNKLPSIDLMVLTHFDDDHIAGLIEYVKQHKSGDFPVERIWANCAKSVPIHISSAISYTQAETLDKLLNKIGEEHAFVRDENINNTLPTFDLDFCKIQILSPTPEALNVNTEKYKENVATIASTRVENDSKKTLEELATNENKQKKEGEDVINRSSIAFTIEAEGKTLLMMGDADPWIVHAKLKTLGYSEENPLKVDMMKVSHHGSRNNTCNELLSVLDCNNYIFSTNGGYGNSYHPDRETLAKVLCHPKREKGQFVNLYFNYEQKEIEQRTGVLLTEEEKQKHNCNVNYGTVIIPLDI